MMQTSHIPDVQNSNVSASEEIVEQETFWDKEIKNSALRELIQRGTLREGTKVTVEGFSFYKNPRHAEESAVADPRRLAETFIKSSEDIREGFNVFTKEQLTDFIKLLAALRRMEVPVELMGFIRTLGGNTKISNFDLSPFMGNHHIVGFKIFVNNVFAV